MTSATRTNGRLLHTVPARVRRSLAVRSGGSPARLRAAAAGTAAVAIVLALAGGWAVDRRADAMEGAAVAADQLIRVQDVRVLVVQADSLASSAYLVGGQEPAEQRARYDELVDAAASGLVAVASGASGGTAELLAGANGRLSTYVALVEQARANNRQGFPVGAAYQRQAREVSTSLVVELREVEQAARDRVNERMTTARRAGWVLVLPALALLVALVAGSVWLARRWRRLVNLPIAAAGLLALAVLAVGGGSSARAMSRADDAVTGPLAAADLLAQARAAAFDARSNEALTLIARGAGASYEEQWLRASSIVDAAVGRACERFDAGCRATSAYGSYRRAHEAIRELDDAGRWDDAVALSLTGSAPAAPGAADPVVELARFEEEVGAAVRERSAEAARALDGAIDPLRVLRSLVVLAGIAAAVLAVAGYSQRLREYR